MKYESMPIPTIIFKSKSDFYEKEKSGKKANTVRIVDDFELRYIEVSDLIKIVNAETGEHFTQIISDLSILGSILGKPLIVISWDPNEVIA